MKSVSLPASIAPVTPWGTKAENEPSSAARMRAVCRTLPAGSVTRKVNAAGTPSSSEPAALELRSRIVPVTSSSSSGEIGSTWSTSAWSSW